MSLTALEIARRRAQYDVDRAAGSARMRYVLDVPGQAETYRAKAEQARAYQASYAQVGLQAAVPPYVAAEASARQASAIAVANAIVTANDQWHANKGPAIEGARIAGRLAVAAALTEQDIDTARTDALAALAAI